MWGILHILDYFHRYSSKKKLPCRRNGRAKYSSCYGRPKTISFSHYCDDVEEYLDAEAVPLMVDEQTANAGSTKITDKNPVKTLLDKEVSARSGLQQTISIPDLEPSNHTSGIISSDWRNPIIILHKNADTNTTNTSGYSKVNQHSATPAISSQRWDKLENPSTNRTKSDHRESSCRQFKECTDVLELFQVNQKLFLEILQDADIQVTKSARLDNASITNLRLKKSGSFPAADCPYVHHTRPVKLENKKMEIRAFQKVEKFPTATQTQKVVASISLDGAHAKSIAFMADVCEGAAISQDTTISSLVSSQHLDKTRWGQSFMTQFRDIKKKIKLALKELKKTKSHTTTVPLLNRVSKGISFSIEKQNPEILEEAPVQKDGEEHPRSSEMNGSNNNLSQGGLTRMRRASSMNESLIRYACLLENTFSREATWHQYRSMSLRLTSEDKFPMGGNRLKSFKRRLSLTEFESSYTLPIETSLDIVNSRMGIRPVMDGDANFKSDGDDENDLKPVTIVVDGKQFCGKETVEDTQTQEYMIERGVSTENNHNSSCSRSDIDVGFPSKCKKHGDLIEIRKQEHISHQDQNVGSVNNNGIDEQTLFPNFETHYKDKIDKRELPILQGIDSNSSSSGIHERDSIANLQEKPVQYSVAQSCCTTSCVNMENANAWTYYHFLHLESNCCNNDFNYVRDVLEIAGFNEEDHFGRWYSLDQPLNPLVFKELEAYLHPELNTSEGYTCSCDHRLLFDLMNELLLEMYNSSLAYFPEPLSFIQRHISPLRNGGHALEEVWKRVSLLRRPQSLMDKSLDDIVGGDMENGNGWMNLILEGEDVALDLEDMIFEEVLDEIECI